MRKLAIVEINLRNYSHERVFEVNFPGYSDNGFYRQTLSLSAFFHGTRNRNVTSTTLYFYHRWEDFEVQCEMTSKIEGCGNLDDRKLPRTQLNGIWEFYKAIGYDYKTRKYIK